MTDLSRTVILDLDGTLADTGADLIAAANACFRDMGEGAPLDPVRDKATAFRGGRAMLRLGFERTRGAWSEAEIDPWYDPLLRHYEAHIDDETVLYPGAMDAVRAMTARGWPVGICTNKPEALAVMLLDRLGVREAFGALVGADRLAVRKPHPDHYRAAVLECGGDLSRSVMVGDTSTDRETARQAGVPSILVAFGPEGKDVARLEPDALLLHYDDLIGLVERLIPAA